MWLWSRRVSSQPILLRISDALGKEYQKLLTGGVPHMHPCVEHYTQAMAMMSTRSWRSTCFSFTRAFEGKLWVEQSCSHCLSKPSTPGRKSSYSTIPQWSGCGSKGPVCSAWGCVSQVMNRSQTHRIVSDGKDHQAQRPWP